MEFGRSHYVSATIELSQIFLSYVHVVNRTQSIMPSTVLKVDLFTSDMIKYVICWRSSAEKLYGTSKLNQSWRFSLGKYCNLGRILLMRPEVTLKRGEFYELRRTRSSTRGFPTSTVLALVTNLSHLSMQHTRDRRIWSMRCESCRLRK